jgi:NADP-dependent 3-hydroxy acid dehydrogenase YdfG
MTETSQGLAVVTGASSAIGGAIATASSEEGYDLALLGRDSERLRGVREACRMGRATAYAVGLTDDAAMEQVVEGLRAEQGEPCVLVHAAGLFDWAPADKADVDAWARLVDLNLTAVMRLTRLLLPSLLSHAQSAVILIASAAGHQGFANNAAYVASKHGVVGFGRALFADLRDRGTKVSVISPGLVAAGASLTFPAHLHPRFLQHEDVAAAVRYVLATAPGACPTEIRLEPQRTPD